ncbi:hypothetical protein C8J57DRAFT_97798 [Mycena rebaudengoi]|nr:hypothetical protein C8J57DRAFT_97798 [Mycena rebaudengoi]
MHLTQSYESCAMRDLPSELWSEIFLLCGVDQEGHRPRLIATVSTRWRSIVLSTPRFWCKVELADWEVIKPRALIPLLSLQLERSGTMPLSIIYGHRFRDNSVLKLLLTSSERWHSADILFTSLECECFRIAASHFPALKKLTLRERHIQSITPWLPTNSFPRLEELALDYPTCPTDFRLPWTQLNKCVLLECTPPQVLQIIPLISNATHLSLSLCFTRAEDSLWWTPVTSNIRSITLLRCTADFNAEFFRWIVTPKLRELVVEDLARSEIGSQIMAFLVRSSCSVTRLSLLSVNISEHELIKLLQLTDRVEHLEIHWPYDVHSNLFMERLTIGPGTSPLVPRLQVLNLTGGLSCSDEQLFIMLESRCRRLRSVRLYYAGRAFFFDPFAGLFTKRRNGHNNGA